MVKTESGAQLAELIKKAIDDCQLTTSEYQQILDLADADGVIDSYEKKLLQQLQEMISHGAVKRIPG